MTVKNDQVILDCLRSEVQVKKHSMATDLTRKSSRLGENVSLTELNQDDDDIDFTDFINIYIAIANGNTLFFF